MAASVVQLPLLARRQPRAWRTWLAFLALVLCWSRPTLTLRRVTQERPREVLVPARVALRWLLAALGRPLTLRWPGRRYPLRRALRRLVRCPCLIKKQKTSWKHAARPQGMGLLRALKRTPAAQVGRLSALL